MHAAFASDTIAPGGEAHFHTSFPAAPLPAAIDPVPVSLGRYGEGRRPSLSCIAAVVAAHAVVLVGLVQAKVIAVPKAPPPPLVVVNLAEPLPPPPPPAIAQPEVKQVVPVEPPIVSPPPIVATPTPPPPLATVPEAPSPQAVVVAPAPKVAAPVAVDLATKLVSGKPPRYPTESRRKREQGTVVLRVTVALDGSVAGLAVAQSSGFERLDRAALDAVRNWRWSPTLVAGQPVSVVGVVPFPFVLQG